MKTKFFISIILILLSIVGYSQPTFSRVIDTAYVESLTTDLSGNFYLNGFVSTIDSSDFIVAKFDNQANLQWAKGFDIGKYEQNGSIVNKSDTLFIGTSIFKQQLERNIPLGIKLTTNGDTLWSRAIDLGMQWQNTFAHYCPDNGFLLSGSGFNDGQYVFGLIKLSHNGAIEWTKAFAFGVDMKLYIKAKQANDGSIYVSGVFAPNFGSGYKGLLFKFNAFGNLLWSKSVYNPAKSFSTLCDLVLENESVVLYAFDDYPAILKLDSSGEIIWSYSYLLSNSGTINNLDCGIVATSTGYAFITSFFSGGAFAMIDFEGKLERISNIALDGVGVQGMPDGGFLLYGNGPIGGIKNAGSQIGLIKCDSLGSTDSCIYSSNAGFETSNYSIEDLIPKPLVGYQSFPSSFYIRSINLLKYPGCVDFLGGIADNTQSTFQLIASPNPTSGQFELSFSDNQNHKVSSLEVVNALGEVVYQSCNSFSSTLSIDLSHQASGIYLMKAYANDKVFVAKVLVID
jgi:hypothetical protein